MLKDSLQQVSPETMLILMDEQAKQVKAGKKKPSFKQLIAEAIREEYSNEP